LRTQDFWLYVRKSANLNAHPQFCRGHKNSASLLKFYQGQFKKSVQLKLSKVNYRLVTT